MRGPPCPRCEKGADQQQDVSVDDKRIEVVCTCFDCAIDWTAVFEWLDDEDVHDVEITA